MTSKCHLLLAEDNMTEVALAQEIFRIAGWTFKIVGTGSAAVDAVKREKFDIILMDFHLPELTGAQATLVIRGWEKSMQKKPVPIIGLTASAMPHEVKECKSSGMDEVITKPYSIDVLLEFLERLCKSGSSVADLEVP